MKKYLTLHNLIKCCAAVFGLVAFFLMFANQLYFELLGNKGYISFSDALFGSGNTKGAVLAFFGYLFILIAVGGLVVSAFAKFDKKVEKIIPLAVAALFLLGALFVLLEAAVYNGANDISSAHLAAGPVIAGIFSILAGCGIVLTLLVKDQKLVK
ncbi:MAG: hypothetical protein J6023_04315 [Clostridia bacterium]|nr:hypothetical protein [Clostridia bacterium]